MATHYKWQKYNCNSAPIWDVRQVRTTGTKTYSIFEKAAYTSSSGKAHPNINSSGKFTFTDGGSAVISTSNWSGKYWISNNDTIKLSTNTNSTSSYYAVITSCSSGFLSIKAAATIYESYQSGTSYSKGTLVGDVLEDSRSAHPDNGRDENDGYWYVYAGEVSGGKLTVAYNGRTLLSLENQEGDKPVQYNGRTIVTLSLGSSKTLKCSGKVMATDVTVGGKTLSCGQKIMAADIIISYSS